MMLHVKITQVLDQCLVVIQTERPHRGALPTIYRTVWQGVYEGRQGTENLPEVEQLLEAAIGHTIACLRNLRGERADLAPPW